jgi:spermidine dehydrogenase
LSDEAADTFQGRPHDFFAMGIDTISAMDAMETGYPGFAGVGLSAGRESAAEMDDPYTFHFPDGNATIARLLVRSLIPAVAAGHTMEDVVTARFDYSALDVSTCPVRLRLRSTAVNVQNADGGVDVGYARNGELHRVHGNRCVLAGYAMMVPAIMPELAEPQAAALASSVKAPIAYVNVAVHDWHPWVRLGVHEITNPMGFFSRLKLDYPVSIGAHRCARTPEEPILLHLVHVPAVRGDELSVRERFRRGRELLYDLTLSDFEERVRDELTRMLSAGGFDADRDIAAITVNRWGHGYAYSGDPVFDSEDDARRPWEAARARVGSIAFANSDSAWEAFAHVAIEEGHRAASELLG